MILNEMKVLSRVELKQIRGGTDDIVNPALEGCANSMQPCFIGQNSLDECPEGESCQIMSLEGSFGGVTYNYTENRCVCLTDDALILDI